jgi:hypothetical protein
MCRCATSPQGPASVLARSTAISRRELISSSPSAGTRSRPAPKPVRPCWRPAEPHAPLWLDGSTSSSTSWSPSLAEALQSDDVTFETLHAYFLDRLVRVCTLLLDAAARAGEFRPDITAYELMRGVGNLCIGAGRDPRYDVRRMVGLLIEGLRLH